MNRIIYILVVLIFGSSLPLFAGDETRTVTLTGANIIPAATIELDVDNYSTYPNQVDWENHFNFKTKSINSYVALSINTDAQTLINYKYRAHVEFLLSHKVLGSTNPITKTISLSIDYDPNSGSTFKQSELHSFLNSPYAKIEISNLTILNLDNSPQFDVVDIKKIVSLNLTTSIERYYNFDPQHRISWELFHEYKTNSDELKIYWKGIEGAEEYDLEYIYIDDYNDSLSYFSPQSITYDFDKGATRVQLTETEYRIPMIYPHGYILYRLRGIGREPYALENSMIGRWSNPQSCKSITIPSWPSGGGWGPPNNGGTTYWIGPYGTVTEYINTFRHCFKIPKAHTLDSLNWQAVTTFAENGKRKDVVTYYDGTIRNRQMVTRLNSERMSLVGETIYDHQGRAAIQTLPAPVNNSSLIFRRDFNLNQAGTNPYSRLDFDEDPSALVCGAKPDKMSPDSGASYYYSANHFDDLQAMNPDTNLRYLPKAFGYPFVQTEWESDNTGRVRRQAGAGRDFILGSGHENMFFYGSAAQEELDTLFGGEVGLANHYKKNMSIDPNGQISLTYLDAKGNTIATCLAGNPPDSLVALDSYQPRSTTINLLAFNSIDDQDYSLSSSFELLVDTKGKQYIDYTMTAAQYQNLLCMDTDICYDCVYDLEIKVVGKACGIVYYDTLEHIGQAFYNTGLIPPVGIAQVEVVNLYGDTVLIDPVCDIPEERIISFETDPLEVGAYTIYKKLKVSESAADLYVGHFLNDPNNSCTNILDSLIQEEVEKIDTINCNIGCESTTDASAAYTQANLGNDYDQKVADVLAELSINACDTTDAISKCETAYLAMLADVSPFGQYGGYDPVTHSAAAFPLSVFNITLLNQLGDGFNTPNYSSVLPSPYDSWTPQTIIENWDDTLASLLVELHPEYCLYERCRDQLSQSDQYDVSLLSTNTLAEAISNGFIDNSDPYKIAFLDPYFGRSPSIDHLAIGYGDINNTTNKIDIYIPNTNNPGGPSLSLKQTAIAIVNCPSSPLSCYGNGWNSDPVIANKEWLTYRSLYMSHKEELEFLKLSQLAINTDYYCYNGCIGKNSFQPPWTNPPLEQSCGLMKFLLYKDKQPRFPNVNNVINIPGDFYNDDPLSILDQLLDDANDKVGDACGQCASSIQLVEFLEDIYKTHAYTFTQAELDGPDILLPLSLDNSSDLVSIAPKNNNQYIELFVNDCIIQLELEHDIVGADFCCLLTIDNPTVFASVSGEHFEFTVNLADGTKKIIEGVTSPGCSFACAKDSMDCTILPEAYDLLDVFNFQVHYDKFTKPLHTISPSWVVGEDLKKALGLESKDVNWAFINQSNGKVRISLGNNSGCELTFDDQYLTNNDKPIQKFLAIKPLFSSSISGFVKDFMLTILYNDASMQSILVSNTCFDVGYCCSDNISPPNPGPIDPEQRVIHSNKKSGLFKKKRKVLSKDKNDKLRNNTINQNRLDSLCVKCQQLIVFDGLLNPIDQDSCLSAQCNPDTLITFDIPNTCVQDLIDRATYNAEQRYQFYLDSIKNAIKTEYMLACLGATESFLLRNTDSRHHFTLYYYDQANNLVKTVPPSETDYLTAGQMANMRDYRKDPSTGSLEYPQYKDWESLYTYNSLNQLTKQEIPDHGEYKAATNTIVKKPSKFWYDKLGRLIVSQNPEQTQQATYSYTKYDPIGRIVEVGKIVAASSMNETKAKDDPKYITWLNSGTRTEITTTTYDKSFSIPAAYSFTNQTQENLRSRISTTAIFDDHNKLAQGKYSHASHYSYDIHGNVKELIQDDPRFTKKKLEYDYDLLSGNVNKLIYQRDQVDQWIHRYQYDADNRIVMAETSTNNILWDKDAVYNYLPHGPLARIELGEEEVQGLDYVYNLQGWIKGMNSGALINPDWDVGQDGKLGTKNEHFAKDVVGFNLNYYDDGTRRDFHPISGNNDFEPDYTGSDFQTKSRNLYNGNIRSMITSIKPFMSQQNEPMGYTYRYDQLNRIDSMIAHTGMANNEWSSSTFTEQYNTSYDYDGNGNINYLSRNGDQSANLPMDQIDYTYSKGGNRLMEVVDGSIPIARYDNDLDGVHRYKYDYLGNLTEEKVPHDPTQNLEISWTNAGKVKQVRKGTGDIINFAYDALGNRTSKSFKNNTTYYVRDASGNVISTYKQMGKMASGGIIDMNKIPPLFWEDAYIYGSARLGIFNPMKCIGGNCKQKAGGGVISTLPGIPSPPVVKLDQRYLGKKRYELTNHLGNVLATISDAKRRKPSLPGQSVYTADVNSASDYYPGGMLMPSKNTSMNAQRYKHQGQESDDEISGTGNNYFYKYRMSDARLNRFWSVDPDITSYTEVSPFSHSYNSFIRYSDKFGKGAEDRVYFYLELSASLNKLTNQGVVVDETINGFGIHVEAQLPKGSAGIWLWYDPVEKIGGYNYELKGSIIGFKAKLVYASQTLVDARIHPTFGYTGGSGKYEKGSLSKFEIGRFKLNNYSLSSGMKTQGRGANFYKNEESEFFSINLGFFDFTYKWGDVTAIRLENIKTGSPFVTATVEVGEGNFNSMPEEDYNENYKEQNENNTHKTKPKANKVKVKREKVGKTSIGKTKKKF